MNVYRAVERMHEAWLVPEDIPNGKHECSICCNRARGVAHYELSVGIICDDCLKGYRFDYDEYPEIGEERLRCTECGFVCDEEVIIFRGRAYCADCVRESKILEDVS
jgi:hypothetical protein